MRDHLSFKTTISWNPVWSLQRGTAISGNWLAH